MKDVLDLLKNSLKFVILCLVIILPSIVFSQPSDTTLLDYLKQSNGFKGVILGSDITHIPSYKLTYLDGDDNFDTDSCLNYEYKEERMMELGNGLRLDLIAIRTYKNKIVNIYLFFKTDDGYEVLRNFLANYGPFTNKAGDFMYDWNTDAVNLSLRNKRSADLGVAIYTCNDLEKKLNEIRLNKKVDFERYEALLGSL